MIQGYGSYKFTGANPTMLPDGAGDIKYEQDYIRDKAWLWDRVGALMQDVYSASGPFLVSGGVVTDDGSHKKVNISSGIGYAPYTLNLGDNSNTPPNTQAEDITALRVGWGNLLSQGNINIAGTWYVVMQYVETDWLTRVRAKAAGSWAFSKQPSYTLTISQTAPTAYQILLATIVSTGSAFTSITQASMNTLVQQYDLVIDSNAKLDLWCQNITGKYKRVYIKAGTWFTTTPSPVGVALINLDACGTTYVFAEKGSLINCSISSVSYGLYHAVALTDMSLERFDNVEINIIGIGGNSGACFYNCTNLTNCTGTGSGTSYGGGFGFIGCKNLTNCTGAGAAGSSGSNVGYGFSNCTNLTNCTGTGTWGGGGSSAGSGFDSCTNLTNCTGTGSGGSSSDSVGYGFSGCTNLINCTGTGSGFFGMGFTTCTNLNNCTGAGIGTGGSGSGDGFGFSNSKNLTNCTGTGSGGSACSGFSSSKNLTNCTGTGSGGSTCYGFSSCTNLTNCIGIGNGGSGGAGYGFNSCIGVGFCAGQGLSSTTGVGFYGCNKMQQNKAYGASSSATYSSSYADAANISPCADSAAGGFNTP